MLVTPVIYYTTIQETPSSIKPHLPGVKGMMLPSVLRDTRHWVWVITWLSSIESLPHAEMTLEVKKGLLDMVAELSNSYERGVGNMAKSVRENVERGGAWITERSIDINVLLKVSKLWLIVINYGSIKGGKSFKSC